MIVVASENGIRIGTTGKALVHEGDTPEGSCCCEKCCCTHIPASYECTLGGIIDDPFNRSCCACNDLNATFTLDKMGTADCDGTHFCAVFMSAPFSSCSFLFPTVDIGPLVMYMTLEENGDHCIAKLYIMLYSNVDLDTLCMISPSQLFNQFCSNDGISNTVARFSSDTGSGGSFPDNCDGNIVMGQPSQGPCEGWPDGISTFLTLTPSE